MLVCYAEHYSFGHYYCAFRTGAIRRGEGDLCPWCRDAMGRVCSDLAQSIARFVRRARVAELQREASSCLRAIYLALDDDDCGRIASAHHAALTELAELARGEG